ncbi:GlcG/HbpS family heme-binding protein [Simplicispira psychrophila]|uniref:GlcG/HbpS family heme-binding protein n=1 Tax=Simplicispira psychrophila TaxID=80882 RepID=UPI000563F0EF|nr:heme-binding protein [Simplicispira psychrophila]
MSFRLSARSSLTAFALYATAASSAFAASPAAVLPAQVLQQPNVSLALANDLINATLAACHAEGRSAVAVVVDRGGNLVAVQRDDNVGPHNTDAAVRKAFTALSTKSLTRQLATNARANPDSQNLNTVDALLLIGGGVPLRIGTEVIGAMGVGGAGGAVQDESCALQAIAKILPAALPAPAP